MFTGGVMSRRCIAWLIDIVLLGVLMTVLWLLLFAFGLATFGLGFGAFGILPFVPFLYHFLSLLSTGSATPGQRIMGLTVRRDFDLGPPGAIQALISVLAYFATLMATGVLFAVALFTRRSRTLHDLASGLVMVRTDAMRSLTGGGQGWNS
jgi:uncharacterized RDD family membrane protein YckC